MRTLKIVKEVCARRPVAVERSVKRSEREAITPSRHLNAFAFASGRRCSSAEVFANLFHNGVTLGRFLMGAAAGAYRLRIIPN